MLVNEPEKISFINKILSYVRGFLARKYFLVNRKKLETAHKTKIESLLIDYKFPNILKAENKRTTNYSKMGWQEFYPSDEKKFVKNYGRVLNTQLIHISSYEIYQGSINYKNQKHGYGVSIFKNGTKFTGFWEENNFEGWGEMIDCEGNIYHGEFTNGNLNGKGVKYSINGNFYKGQFKNGLRSGHGLEETKEHTYKGNYENDKKNKIGKLVYKNIKDTYEGEFHDNNITGKGEYSWENGDTFIGDFINGKMDGRGHYKWPDGGEYEGTYINNIKQGTGRFKWSNGKIFEGPFVDGIFYF